MTKYRKFTFKCPTCGQSSEDGYLIFSRKTLTDIYVDHFVCFEDGNAFAVEGEELDNFPYKEYFRCPECREEFSWSILFNTGAVVLGEEVKPELKQDSLHPENMPDFPLEPGKTYLMPVKLKSKECRFDGGRGTEFFVFENPMGMTTTISDHYLKQLKPYDE